MRGGMRNPMPEQPADIRNKNFEEVALGYDMATAVSYTHLDVYKRQTGVYSQA